MFRALIMMFLLTMSSIPAFAQANDAAKRREIVPYIKTATNCMAAQVLDNAGLAAAVKSGTLQALLKDLASRCAPQINAMIAEHEHLYGYGTGLNFFQGAYMNDLPNAIQKHWKKEIDEKLADAARAEEVKQAEEKAADEKRIADAEGRRKEIALQEAERKADQERRQSALRMQEQQRAAEKTVALNTAQRAASLLRDKLYECADQNLARLVKSGEGAEVLASAVMTICRNDLDATSQSLIDVFKIDAGVNDVTGLQHSAIVGEITKAVKDRLIASAVEAKAAAAR
jgi:hypothetical protein